MYIEKTLQKFNKDKSYVYFPGNTIIHFIDNPEQIKILTEIKKEMSKHPLFEKFVLLPEASYHMTVCDILTYFDLFTHERFAKFNHKDLHKISEIDQAVVEDLGKVWFELGITMVPVAIQAKRVELRPRSLIDVEKLRVFREFVSTKVGFDINPNYKFHISLAYQLQQLTDDEKTVMDAFLTELNDKYLKALGCIDVKSADFVLFNDMYEYGLYENGRSNLGVAKSTYTEV